MVLARACLADQAPEIADSLGAVVNEVPITQQAVERISGTEEQYLRQQYADQPDVFYKKVVTLRQNASEFLINREVILHDFKTSIKVPDSIIDEIINDRIKAKYPDNVVLTKQLQSQGTTLEQLKQQFRDQFIVEQMRLKFVPEPIISPRKIEEYYSGHLNDFKIEDQIKMRMIFSEKDFVR